MIALDAHLSGSTATTTPNDAPAEEIEVLSDEEKPESNELESVDLTSLDEPFDEGFNKAFSRYQYACHLQHEQLNDTLYKSIYLFVDNDDVPDSGQTSEQVEDEPRMKGRPRKAGNKKSKNPLYSSITRCIILGALLLPLCSIDEMKIQICTNIM